MKQLVELYERIKQDVEQLDLQTTIHYATNLGNAMGIGPNNRIQAHFVIVAYYMMEYTPTRWFLIGIIFANYLNNHPKH